MGPDFRLSIDKTYSLLLVLDVHEPESTSFQHREAITQLADQT